ncbi:uncharacterized protein LOC109704956 [Ananas comosus]|uniref:Uncharacterized protein LOC109704956 n=1 Tax=Ananas comosus TaxID=4615 RepID=A0A6P5EDI0_ANACO|nr:uncharacterized protein LOC109704956 [Ananas comosus]XP_020081303.1 uncharacterized protein LOC109704956 [Ananas comosus]
MMLPIVSVLCTYNFRHPRRLAMIFRVFQFLYMVRAINLLKLMEILNSKPGCGVAFVRTKLLNYIIGSIVEKTFQAGTKEGYHTFRGGFWNYFSMDSSSQRGLLSSRSVWRHP